MGWLDGSRMHTPMGEWRFAFSSGRSIQWDVAELFGGNSNLPYHTSVWRDTQRNEGR